MLVGCCHFSDHFYFFFQNARSEWRELDTLFFALISIHYFIALASVILRSCVYEVSSLRARETPADTRANMVKKEKLGSVSECEAPQCAPLSIAILLCAVCFVHYNTNFSHIYVEAIARWSQRNPKLCAHISSLSSLLLLCSTSLVLLARSHEQSLLSRCCCSAHDVVE